MNEPFPVVREVEVRWRDTDALGHVNNAVFLTYFEVGRVAFYQRVFGAERSGDIDFILASVACDFLSPVFFGDRVAVAVRVSRAGRTSFEFEYELRRLPDGAPVARGRSTQVLYDYGRDAKKEVSAPWLAAVAKAQGAPVPRA